MEESAKATAGSDGNGGLGVGVAVTAKEAATGAWSSHWPSTAAEETATGGSGGTGTATEHCVCVWCGGEVCEL